MVRRKEGVGAASGGLGGRLSLSSIAAMAQQALAVGGDSGGGTTGVGAAVRRLSVGVGGNEESKEEESTAEVVGEMDAIEALAPVLDKSNKPPTYGTLPTTLPSPTTASPPAIPAEQRSADSSGTATATTSSSGDSGRVSGSGELDKLPSSASTAPPNTVLLHDLLAWDGQ